MSITKPNRPSGETISGSWRLDPQRSSIGFRVGHFWGLVTVTGHFDDYHGQLDLSANPAVELTIEAASMQTGNRKRDQHLRSADFFDIESHPQVLGDGSLPALDIVPAVPASSITPTPLVPIAVEPGSPTKRGASLLSG